MATSNEIFMERAGAAEDVLPKIVTALGLGFDGPSSGSRAVAQHQRDWVVASLFAQHDFDDDPGLDFSSFRFWLLLEGREAEREQLANQLFDRLRADGHFAILLTRNVEEVLARFTPADR